MDREDLFHLGVKALLHNRQGSILLLKAKTFCGGRTHKHETIGNALKREIFEETGLDAVKLLEPESPSLLLEKMATLDFLNNSVDKNLLH